jgi:ankyrin repeat protein
MKRKPRAFLWMFVSLLVLIGLPVWLVQRQRQQERLDTALLLAFKEYRPDRALALLQQGADPNADFRSTMQPKLSWWDSVCIAFRLKKPTFKGFTPLPALYIALLNIPYFPDAKVPTPWHEVVRVLLERGADPNKRSWNLPLECAAETGDRLSIGMLLMHGADLHSRGENGATPLMYAVSANAETVELLLEHGARVNDRNNLGHNALQWAISQHSSDPHVRHPPTLSIVKALIAHGADIHTPDKQGMTPLMWAKSQKLLDVAQVLKAAGTKR